MDLKGVDPSLIAALVQVVEAHVADKKAPEPVAMVEQLWAEWEPIAMKLSSGRVVATHGRNFRRTRIRLEDGRELTVFELAWKEAGPLVADLYRSARLMVSSGRRGRDGKIGKVSDGTVNRELISLQSCFSYHRDRTRKIPYNPIDGFNRPSEEGSARQTYLTPEEAKIFIEAGPPMWQDICTVAYRCAGMRHSEARLLRKSEIEWESKTIRLPSRRNKNGRARVIPFPDDVEPILRRHCEISRGPYVFVSTKDPKRMDPVGGSFMQYWMEKVRETTGLVGVDGENVVVHSLRHAGVTRLVEINAPEPFIRAAAGMSPNTLKRYTKFQRPQQEILRDHMNKLAPPPPPPLTVIPGDRKDPRRAPAPAPIPAPLQVASGDSED
jgi:integrase